MQNVSPASGAHPTATFPCDHLSGSGGVVAERKAAANPAAAFPNNQLAGSQAGNEVRTTGAPKWSASQSKSPLAELREAVKNEDWAGNFAEAKTKMQVQAEWSASEDRCQMLQCFCTMNRVKRVLEVGAFCGVASLAMAEVLPEDGKVLSFELDPFLVEFGQNIIAKSPAHNRIKTEVGLASDLLKDVVEKAKSGAEAPFDLVVVDADKAGMVEYCRTLWETPGLLSDSAVVCVDMTPFKGQPPERYVRFGQADKWVNNSGQESIDALRADLQNSTAFTAFEFGGLVVVQRAKVHS